MHCTSLYSFFDCTRQSWRPRLQDGFWPALKVLKTQDFARKDLDCCLKWFFLATNIPLICGFAFLEAVLIQTHSAQTLEFKLAHGLMYCNAMIHWIQKGCPSCSVFLHVLIRVDIAPRRVKILSLSICFNMFQHVSTLFVFGGIVREQCSGIVRTCWSELLCPSWLPIWTPRRLKIINMVLLPPFNFSTLFTVIQACYSQKVFGTSICTALHSKLQGGASIAQPCRRSETKIGGQICSVYTCQEHDPCDWNQIAGID